MIDTFLSTSGKSFYDVNEPGKKVRFSCRLWLDTTLAGFNSEAENTIKNQMPEVKRWVTMTLPRPRSIGPGWTRGYRERRRLKNATTSNPTSKAPST
jgi:hypothetical protein